MKSFKYVSAVVALFAASCAFGADATKTIDTGVSGAVLTQTDNEGKVAMNLELTVEDSMTSTLSQLEKGMAVILKSLPLNQAKALNAAFASLISSIDAKSAIAPQGSVIKISVMQSVSEENGNTVVSTNLSLGLRSGTYAADTKTIINFDNTAITTGKVMVDGETHEAKVNTLADGTMVGNVEGVASIATQPILVANNNIGAPLPLPTDPSHGDPSVNGNGFSSDSTPVPDNSIVTSQVQ